MQIRVLGCSGGIGGTLRTTSMLIDDDILIDCGTGVGDLTMDELLAIRHVFITHAHLDHVCMLPMLVDSVFESLADSPITIHASAPVLEALDTHLFNWQLWPDFFVLPTVDSPALVSRAIEFGESIELGGRTISPLPVYHTVPAQGYLMSAPSGRKVAFSGDTGPCEPFWQQVAAADGVECVIVECAYDDGDAQLASLAKHYTPATLAADIRRLEVRSQVRVTHLKPGVESLITAQLEAHLSDLDVRPLQSGQIFSL